LNHLKYPDLIFDRRIIQFSIRLQIQTMVTQLDAANPAAPATTAAPATKQSNVVTPDNILTGKQEHCTVAKYLYSSIDY
jgi:hypothetical protein